MPLQTHTYNQLFTGQYMLTILRDSAQQAVMRTNRKQFLLN